MTNTTHAIERMYFFEVARLLREPQGPIHFLVHVRDREALSEIASWIEREREPGPVAASELMRLVWSLAVRDIVRLSPRSPLRDTAAGTLVDPASINHFCLAEAVRVPPYCLVHGPGIFQDKLQTRLWSDWGTAPAGKTLEYGHSY